MEDYLIYIAKSAGSMLLFYLAYKFLMKNDTFFKLSRYYLLIAFIASMLLPLINFSGILDAEEPIPIVYYTMDAVSISADAVKETVDENISVMTYIAWGYMAITGLFLLRFLLRLSRIGYLCMRYNSKKIGRYRIYELSPDHSPFSFFNLIFINGDNLNIDEFEKIIQHERVHAKQFHTLDLMLLEIAGAIFWINPMIGIYKKSLQEVHEFIADDEVCRSGVDALDYKKLMVKQLTGLSFESPANCFNSIKIRRRFGMITKSRTGKQALLKLTAIVPLSLVVLFIYACADNLDNIDNLASSGVYTYNDEGVEPPKPPMSRMELSELRDSKMKLPPEAVQNNYTGKIAVTYIIDEEGKVVNPKVVNGCDLGGEWTEKGLKYGCNDEAVRIIGTMPRWDPAMKDGKPVRFQMTEIFVMGDKDAWKKEHRLSYYNSKVNKDIKEEDINPAYFPGGDEALWKFIEENVKYPEEARRKGIQGTIELELGIDKEGNVAAVKSGPITKGNSLLLQEAWRIAGIMPKWEPAIYKKTGKPIEMYVKVPIHFRLNDEEAKTDKMHIYMDGDKRIDPKDMHPAQYPGGNQALIKFLSENIKYPEEARKKGIEDEFKIGVMISSDGSVDNIELDGDAPDILEKEARRVIDEMPRWLPGYHKKTGKNVPYFVYIPFKFKLSDKKKVLETQPSFDNSDLYGEIKYPEEALKAGKQGKVILKVTVDKTGEITNCEVESSTDKVFEQAALNAMKKVKMTPGTTKHGPVVATIFVPIHFKLK